MWRRQEDESKKAVTEICCRNGDDTFNLNRIIHDIVSDTGTAFVRIRIRYRYSCMCVCVLCCVQLIWFCRKMWPLTSMAIRLYSTQSYTTDRIPMRICNIFTSHVCFITFYITTYYFIHVFIFVPFHHRSHHPPHSSSTMWARPAILFIFIFTCVFSELGARVWVASACFWFSQSHIIIFGNNNKQPSE